MAQTNDQFSQLDLSLHLLLFEFHMMTAVRPSDCPVHVSGATRSLNISRNSRKAQKTFGYAYFHLVPCHFFGTVQAEEWRNPQNILLVSMSNITLPRPSTGHLPLSLVLLRFSGTSPRHDVASIYLHMRFVCHSYTEALLATHNSC